jgi:hypothetical protein
VRVSEPPSQTRTPRRTRSLVIAAVAAVALLLAAGAVTAVLRARAGRAFTQADADAALLSEADLAGYRLADPADGPDNEDDDLVPCGAAVAVNRIGLPSTRRETTLARGGFGPFLTHQTALGPGEADATEAIAKLRRAFGACTGWTQPNGDRYQVTRWDGGSYADATFGVRLDVTGDELTVAMAIVAIRKRNLVSMVILAEFPDLSDEDIRVVVDAAAAKLP